MFGKRAALNTPSATLFFQKERSGLDYSNPLQNFSRTFGRKIPDFCHGLLSSVRSHSALDCTVPRPQLCISLVGNTTRPHSWKNGVRLRLFLIFCWRREMRMRTVLMSPHPPQDRTRICMQHSRMRVRVRPCRQYILSDRAYRVVDGIHRPNADAILGEASPKGNKCLAPSPTWLTNSLRPCRCQMQQCLNLLLGNGNNSSICQHYFSFFYINVLDVIDVYYD